MLNIGTSIAGRIVLLLAGLYVRRLLISCVGNEVNGLNALYGSIIGLLSVAELGVGSAIVFSMYRPIVDGDQRKVAALYCLYRRLYRIIGAVIFGAGIALMPFLPKLIKDYDTLDINVYATFFLTLVSVVLSYLYSAKTSLIEAHKNNYITTGIVTIARMMRYALQIASLLIWGSYTIFLVCQIIETVIIWIMTEKVVDRLYPDMIRMDEKLDSGAIRDVTKNVKAMFMHKIGAILVGAVDSMVISAFVGVMILGKYSNYGAIAAAMTGIISLFFTPLTSVIGHLCASCRPEEIKKEFDHFYTLNYVLGLIFFLGYYAVIDNVIMLFFGPGLGLSRVITYIMTLNGFVSYMRFSPLLFRDASGTFWNDRWKPAAEGLINLVLSVLFVKLFPEEYSVAGVIAATIVTILLICDIVEPHIIFKYVFKVPARGFYVMNYSGIALFACCLLAMEKLRVTDLPDAVQLLINGMISLALSAAVLLLLGMLDRKFANECRVIISQAGGWVRDRCSRRSNKDNRNK